MMDDISKLQKKTDLIMFLTIGQYVLIGMLLLMVYLK